MIRRLSFTLTLPSGLLVFVAACGQGRGSAPAEIATTTTPLAATAPATATPSGAPDAAAPEASDAGPPDDASAPASAVPEGMTEIPAGVFVMGSPASVDIAEEHPQHEVAVARFYLDTTEVTTGAYKKCVAEGKCKTTHPTRFCNEPHTDRDDHPINCVDYFMAEAYCQAVGKRLPTEREWEYAARGGSEQRMFSWGAEDPSSKNACYEHGESCPVKSFPPGAFGLYDVSGNVWEWTSSWFGRYPDEATEGSHKVYRGGSWSRRFPKWLRNGLRNRYLPKEFSAAVGMRCAKDAPPLTCPKDHTPQDGACIRTSGQSWCEPGHPWDGKECSGYAHTSKASAAASGTAASGTAAPQATAKTPEDIASQPIIKTRTPKFDDDCKAHYPGKPAAYQFKGNTFHARNPMIDGGGCSRRDMGHDWTSACCPG